MVLQDFAGLCRIVFMELCKLLFEPESKTIKFKRDLSSLEPILKTIVAFANTAGGTLVIGKSAEGKIVGVKDVLKDEESLVNAIADTIYPFILPEVEIITVEGKSLLVVRVAHWKGPFYIKREGIPRGVYIRLGSSSRPAGPEFVAELQRLVTNVSYDQQPLTDLSCNDLETGSFHNKEKLQSLGLLVRAMGRLVPTVGSIILFGKNKERERLVPDARVSCARFLGNTKANILDRYEVEGPILNAIEQVPKFIARNTRLSSQFGEIKRKDIPEYPMPAIREALINALVHADYSITGSHIQIAIFDDRLEIQNPGMFPFGFTFEDLKAGISRVRNRVIARTFHSLQYMEEWGSGYKRIMETCHSEGYPEPKWEEIGTSIRVTFYPYLQVCNGFTLKEEPAQEEIMDREVEILALFKKEESLPFREIAKRLKFTVSERTLRYTLSNLKRKGFLISRGKGRAIVLKKIK